MILKFFGSNFLPHTFYVFSDRSCPSMFFLTQFVRRACPAAGNTNPSVFFLQITFPNPSPCLLNSNFFCFADKFAMNLFLFPLPLSSFFYFLAVDIGPSYSREIFSLLQSFQLTQKERKILFFSFYTVCNTKDSPRPPSIVGMHRLSMSLCRWYILFIIIIICDFLSITFRTMSY